VDYVKIRANLVEGSTPRRGMAAPALKLKDGSRGGGEASIPVAKAVEQNKV
jgi:hypothetical protein